jgi:type II secretory pathway pseudopilin PulG
LDRIKMRRNDGYTLIELLLYVAMIAILLSAVTAFLGLATDARVKGQTISEVNEQGTAAIEYVSQTIRNATAISSPAAASSSSTLTLTVPTASLNPTIFNVTSGVLQVKEGTGSTVSLTDSKVQVVSFTVTNLTRSGTSGIVQVSLTLARNNSTGRNEYDYQRTFTTSAGIRP